MKDEKRGRGRPSVYMKVFGHEDNDRFFEYQTKRAQAAHAYAASVFGLLSEAASDIPYLDGIFRIEKVKGRSGCIQKCEIIEQLGRMREQDGYSDKDILTIARIAAQAYHDGATVKQIKQYILLGRTSGVWTGL